MGSIGSEYVRASTYRVAVSAVDALAAALEHVLRDPTIAHHAGWQEDARKALAAARGDSMSPKNPDRN